MNKSIIYLLAALVIPFSSKSLYAQQAKNNIDSIVSKIDLYQAKKSSSVLFAHFDKTVYTNNEDVWFTTYLVKASLPVNQYHLISTVLVSDDTHKISVEKMFVMNNGLSFGHFVIPDTLLPGNYHIIVYPDKIGHNGIPENIFYQPITLKKAKVQDFTALIELTGDTSSNILTAKLQVNSVATKPDLVMDAYYTINGTEEHVATNNEGKLLIKIPRDLLPIGQTEFKIIVKKGSESSCLMLKLPKIKETTEVKFYPEGGNLIAGLINLVGWEAKTFSGKPVNATGILFKNDSPVDTIVTNSYGIGIFKLLPENNSRYVLKILDPNGTTNNKSWEYPLPEAIQDIPQLHIENVLPSDTLEIQLKSLHRQKVMLLVHDYKNIIAYQTVEVDSKLLKLKVLLNDAPKGLASVTILNAEGNPLAERICFLHYGQEDAFKVSTDRTEYKSRQKVQLKLSLLGLNSRPATGIVSIACVQENRIESNKQRNIQNYIYLQNELQQIPADPTGLNFKNRDYVEDLLLIKGWSRYTWLDMLKTNVHDTIKKLESPAFVGRVRRGDKLLKAPSILTLISQGRPPQLLNTDAQGNFNLTTQNLIVPEDIAITMMVAENNPEQYNLGFDNPYHVINIKISKNVFDDNYSQYLNKNAQPGLNNLENVVQLNEVKIKGQRDQQFLNITHHGVFKDCDDYVCRSGVLNCKLCRYLLTNTAPVIGKTYLTNDDQKITYTGCLIIKNSITPGGYKQTIEGIKSKKEFYGWNESESISSIPELQSTLYWNYGVNLNSTAETNLTFYTGDIQGRFKIIIQGKTDKDLLYKEIIFDVKR